MLTLWDLLPKAFRPRQETPVVTRAVAPAAPRRIKPRAIVAAAPVATPGRPGASAARPGREKKSDSMQDRYNAVARDLLAQYGIKVRRWRTSMSGVAWEVRYRDGSRARFIESPRPKGPMSVAVFLHEIGHHAIGFNVYRPRCLEEYHAWAWALAAMERYGLNITNSVRRRMHRSLHYAIGKASRRGLQKLPPELAPYRAPWVG
ncbi:MAG TPA: hypothetical protein VG797_08690 [Phycisphaerales bacterium]|nr:hypothetical protein [Phycisphaerales bacterium]